MSYAYRCARGRGPNYDPNPNLNPNPNPSPKPNPNQVREGEKAHRTDAHRQGPQTKGVVHGTITKQLKVIALLLLSTYYALLCTCCVLTVYLLWFKAIAFLECT